MKMPAKIILSAVTLCAAGSMAASNYAPFQVSGRGSVIAEPDLAALPVSITLSCYASQEEAATALGKAVEVARQALEPFKSGDKLDRVIAPTPALVQDTEWKAVTGKNKKGRPVSYQVPVDGCENVWKASVTVTLITHKTKDLGKAEKALTTAIQNAQVIRLNANPADIRNTLNVTNQQVRFWLTEDGRKPFEAQARKLAWAHMWKKFESTRAQCRFQEAHIASIAEGGARNPRMFEKSMRAAPSAASFEAAGGAAPQEVETVEVSASGQVVKSQLTVTWNVASPNACALKANP